MWKQDFSTEVHLTLPAVLASFKQLLFNWWKNIEFNKNQSNIFFWATYVNTFETKNANVFVKAEILNWFFPKKNHVSRLKPGWGWVIDFFIYKREVFCNFWAYKCFFVVWRITGTKIFFKPIYNAHIEIRKPMLIC